MLNHQACTAAALDVRCEHVFFSSAAAAPEAGAPPCPVPELGAAPLGAYHGHRPDKAPTTGAPSLQGPLKPHAQG